MKSPRTCPICHQRLSADPALERFAPFCSERCQRVDLLRWFDGKYAIVEDLDEEQIKSPDLDEDAED